MKNVQAKGFWLRSVIGGGIKKYFIVQFSQIIFNKIGAFFDSKLHKKIIFGRNSAYIFTSKDDHMAANSKFGNKVV